MPFDLLLPRKLRAEGWKVKIRDKERVEPPHLTILHNADEWRLGLRDRRLLIPPGGHVREIDEGVMRLIAERWDELIAAWDAKCPENPVSSTDDDPDGKVGDG